MNKKILALLFAVPTFGLAQTTYETYKVMGFAPSLDQVAVASKDVTGHDVALAITRNGGWYADAKDALVGVGRDNSRQFRLVKTDKANVYKLYSVKKNKFVAYTDANQGDRKTTFVDNATDANTDWLIVPNIGVNGTTNNFDIFPGSVSSPNGATPAWNAFGGANESARIGFWRADDGGSCWSIEVETQEIKFFNSYDEKNESYFMTIRERYVHKHDNRFTADNNLEFGQNDYLFQLVGTPEHFKIYNAATGQPIGTTPGAGLNKKDNEDNNFYRPTAQSEFSVQSYGGRVYVKETRGENIYLNFRDSVLSTWHNALAWTNRDEGSRILFTGEDGILAEAAKKLEAEVNTKYAKDKFGKELGKYPQSAYSGIASVLDMLKKAQDLTDRNIAEKKDNFEYAKAYLETLTLNVPQDGDLLYISAVRGGNVKYLTSKLHVEGDRDYYNKSTAGFLKTGTTRTSDAVFRYTLKGKQASLVSVATGHRLVLAQREDKKFYPTIQSSLGEGAVFSVEPRGDKYVFNSEGHYLSSDANGDYAETIDEYNEVFAGLRLERVTETLPVHIGAGGTASFWSPVEYTVPEGVTAYSVKIENGRAKLAKIETNVPKETAVFLFGPASSDVNLTIVPNGNTPALRDNLLRGDAQPTALSGTAFVLKKDGATLLKISGAVPAFKAYFTATDSQVRELLERGTTGIVATATQKVVSPVYDLNGRRVLSTERGGVYITNGKKFIAQ